MNELKEKINFEAITTAMYNNKFDQIPVCNTIKKILIGKLFAYQYHKNVQPLIILGVQRNPLYGNLMILVGRYYQRSVSIMGWYDYQRNNMNFIGRDNKFSIRKCLKLNPKYVQYHLGRQVDLSNVQLYNKSDQNLYVGKYGTDQKILFIYDNNDRCYENYINNVPRRIY